jgi:4-diphosphocytidyl-2-C-methyl-D-erythritol kinase
LNETLLAPAKLNLCLYVGAVRDDGLHEICSLFEPLRLSDEIRVSPAAGPEDEVVCEGVAGPNLAATALERLREAGWSAPPLRVEISKRIPVAAGLGGGSADAAAVLRLARGEVEGIGAVAASIGADVPSQLEPRPCVVAGAGEVIEPVVPPGPHAVVLVPQAEGLSTADVYAEGDRLTPPRGESELEVVRRRLHDALGTGASPLDYTENLVSDLQPAAVALRPEIEDVLAALSEAGAGHAMVTGSGPTAFGLFADDAGAEEAAGALRDRYPQALATGPLYGAER